MAAPGSGGGNGQLATYNQTYLRTGALPAGITLFTMPVHSDAIQSALGFTEIAGPETVGMLFPAAASLLDIASTSAQDAAGGTGALTVLVIGLDANYDVIQEVKTLTGQTEVVTTNAFIRVNKIVVLTFGTGGTNAGNIYIADDGDTFTAGVPVAPICVLEAGFGASATGVYSVPAGFTLIPQQFFMIATSGKPVEVIAEARTQTGPWIRFTDMSVDDVSSTLPLVSGNTVPAKGDLRFRGKLTGGSGGSVFILVHGLLQAD
jgi:hypothetical protein